MDLFKNNLVAGVGIALAASVLAPILLPVAGRIGRPMAKSLVRGGMLLYEKGREAIAVAGESVEDLMAEVKAEGSGQQQPPANRRPMADAEPVSSAGAAPPATQDSSTGVRFGGNGSEAAAPAAAMPAAGQA